MAWVIRLVSLSARIIKESIRFFFSYFLNILNWGYWFVIQNILKIKIFMLNSISSKASNSTLINAQYPLLYIDKSFSSVLKFHAYHKPTKNDHKTIWICVCWYVYVHMYYFSETNDALNIFLDMFSITLIWWMNKIGLILCARCLIHTVWNQLLQVAFKQEFVLS